MFSLYFSQRISSLNCRYVGRRNGIWRARRCRHSAGSAEGDGTGEDGATGAAANPGSDSTTVETDDRKKNNTSNKSDRMQSKLEKLRRQQKRQELLRMSKVMKVGGCFCFQLIME